MICKGIYIIRIVFVILHYQTKFYYIIYMVFEDKELGTIVIRFNARAKRIIARRKDDHFLFTLPSNFDIKKFEEVLEEMRPRLRKVSVPKPVKFIDEDTIIKTSTVPIVVKRSDKFKYIAASITKEAATVLVSNSVDIDDSSVQKDMIAAINRILSREAKRVLIPRTLNYAKKLNLKVKQVKISSSKNRWGSCSQSGNINLSHYLMLLPDNLIDYVILHELAHIVEMNHSERFWALLDKFCGEDSRAISNIAARYNSEDLALAKSV